MTGCNRKRQLGAKAHHAEADGEEEHDGVAKEQAGPDGPKGGALGQRAWDLVQERQDDRADGEVSDRKEKDELVRALAWPERPAV